MSSNDHFNDISFEGNLAPGANARVTNDLLPSPTADQDLGSASLQWRNFYLSSFYDLTKISPPANPAAAALRIFAKTSTGKLACLDSSGADCMPSGGGGGGTPGGADTNVQYDDAGSFGGDANFTWNKTTHVLTLGTGILDAGTGFRVNGGATSGNVLRGNGTNFVSAVLAASDLSNGVTGSGAVVLASSPSITTPTIASFANATHNHLNAAGGGTLTAAAVAAAGSNTQVQYNNAGAFAGNSGLVFDSATGTLTATIFSGGGAGAGVFTAVEGTAPSGVASSDILYADSTAHRFKMINNNGTAAQVIASGVDINTSDQVTATHLAAALPVNQGGTGTTSTLTGLVRGSASAFTAAELSGVVITSASNVTTPGKADVMQTSFYCQDAGANDTYACNLSPAITAYVTGTHYLFKANTANTGACSINFNSVGAITIKKVAGGITTDLADNDIRVGQWVDCVYDGTNMQMQSTLGNASSSVAFSSVTAGTNTAALVMNTGGSLSFTGSATLDMSADTSATSFKVPVIAGANPSTNNGPIAYDSTQQSYAVGDANLGKAFLDRTLSAINCTTSGNCATQAATTPGTGNGNIDTASGTSGTSTLYFQGINIPANTIIAGKTIRACVVLNFVTSAAAPTMQLSFNLGTTAIVQTTTAVGTGNNVSNKGTTACVLIQGTAAAGAAVAVVGGWDGTFGPNPNSIGVNLTNQINMASAPTVATNGALIASWSFLWSANTAANSVTAIMQTLQVMS